MELTAVRAPMMGQNRSTANDGFFAYHGWLAPGVRLFRAVRFPTKALLIGCTFSLPLIAALFFLVSLATEQIATARAERDGLHYITPVIEVMTIAEQDRAARMDERPVDAARLQAAAPAVVQAHAQYGAAFGVAAPYQAFDSALAAVRNLSSGADTRTVLQAYDALLDAATHLVIKVADGSQLSLDPAADTYNLMSFSLLRGAAMSENLARMHALAVLLQRHPELPLRDDLLTRLGAQRLLLRDMDNAYAEAIKAEPSLERDFDRRAASTAIAAFTAALQGQLDGKPAAGESLTALADQAQRSYGELHQRAMKLLGAQLDQRISDLQWRLGTQLVLSALFVLLAVYFLFAFYRVMMGGLDAVASHLEEITAGNLTTAPEPWGHDEPASLMMTMGAMQTSLRQVVHQVLDGSARIEAASSEIAGASQGLSQRTEQSASHLEEAAASMEQVAQTISNNLEAVESASRIVQENASAAARGHDVMEQLLGTMNGMQDASREIAGIVSVIDSIAFQTNLLALNAAVEAARAGENGRGFAVVAQEVRHLAGRSAESAKHIRRLIDTTVHQMDAGVTVAQEVGAAMEEIRTSASQARTLIGALQTSAHEQRAGVSQVQQMVVEIDGVTQENAAMVEEASGAASSLSDDARQLAETARFFKIV